MIKKFTIFEGHEDIDPFGEEDWNEFRLPYEYDVNVTIGARIQTVLPTNVYILTVENMHGDADAYTYQTVELNTIDDVKKIVAFISYMKRQNHNMRFSEIERIWEMIFDEENGQRLDFIEGDVTYGDGWAMPSVKKVVYYDADGVMFNVNITTRKIR